MEGTLTILTERDKKKTLQIEHVNGLHIAEAVADLKQLVGIEYNHEQERYNESFVVFLQLPSKMNLPGFEITE